MCETFIALKIIKRAELSYEPELVATALIENNELISIFVKSVNTAKKRSKIANHAEGIPSGPIEYLDSKIKNAY